MQTVIDGQLVAGQTATIEVFDDGLLRGDGVFEGIRLYAGRPWALDEHLERMALSARNLRLDFSLAEFLSDIEMLLGSVGPIDALLRLVQTRGGQRISIVEEIPAAAASIELATIEYEPPAFMAKIKSLSYAPNMLAARLARERGAQDALFVSRDGFVLEASRASFFYVLESKLFTPPLEHRILDSITRRHLMAIADATERPTRLDDLGGVMEAFIASTAKEVLPVHAIDGRALPAPGPISADVEAMFASHVQESLSSAPA